MNSIRRRGFSLIEAAIVLGIIGLVLGGIWVAAAAVQQNLSFSRLQTSLLYISKKVGSLYTNMPTSSLEDITGLVISNRLVPDDWVSGSLIVPPIGGPTSVSLNDGEIIFRLTAVTSAQCRRLFMEHNKYGAQTTWGISVENDFSGMEDIYYGADPSTSSCNFPVSGTVGTIIITIPAQ